MDLTKEYTRRQREGKERIIALNEVNVKINEGELFGLLGPNGAGKTTFVKILCTLLLPTSGTAYINGFNVRKDAKKVKSQIGVVLDLNHGWYPRLTGRQNLRFFAALHLIPKSEVGSRIDQVLVLTDMRKRADDWYQKLSTGEKRRLDVARALLSDPPVLLLDEPTLGLDVGIAHKVRDFIRNELCRDQGKTVLLTTHNMHEADEICDRIAIINKGSIIACDDSTAIKGLVNWVTVAEIKLFNASKRLFAKLRQLEGVIQFVETHDAPIHNGYTLRLYLQSPWDEVIPQICEEIIKAGGKIRSIRREEPSLEEAFIQLTGSGI